jgi:hypothetical protein
MRAVARAHAVSLSIVQWWVRRAGDRALDQVEWDDRPPLAKQIHRTAAAVEDVVLTLRRELKDTSALGEYGARAIHHALTACAHSPVPSVRTIGRILARRGALDAGRRLRRPPPPSGWYLPAVAGRRAELDSFDTMEGLALEGGVQLEVLTVVSLHGGLPGAWPCRTRPSCGPSSPTTDAHAPRRRLAPPHPPRPRSSSLAARPDPRGVPLAGRLAPPPPTAP